MDAKRLVEVVLTSLRQHPPTNSGGKTTTDYVAADLQFHTIARLWGGMGYIYRVHVRDHQRVVKYVRLPSSTTPNHYPSRSDQRKADSYHVEANFYQYVAPLLIQQQQQHNSNNQCMIRVPTPYYVERTTDAIFIVLAYIQPSSSTLTPTRTKLVLDWLARFHAATWKRHNNNNDNDNYHNNNYYKHLQPIGTYWHLDTRPDEHARMRPRGWEGRLKKLAARAIQQRLQCDPCQCLVHGDVKEANFLLWGRRR